MYIALISTISFLLIPQARNKKERGQIQEARAYTMGAIACNVITVMAGVVTTIIASIVLQKYFNQIYHRNQFTDPYG